MKKDHIRLTSPNHQQRNNNYYAMENVNPVEKRGLRKIYGSRSNSSKSGKGISLSKDLKKTFEEFYFGVPIP